MWQPCCGTLMHVNIALVMRVRKVVFHSFSKQDWGMTSGVNTMGKRKLVEDRSVNPKKPAGHWSLGLLSAMEDPNLQIQADKDVVVIQDKFPKAKFHYLVLPRQKVSKLSDVQKSHLDLLKHMQCVGLQLAAKHPEHNFKLGYHAEPSMHHLHMHVISDDFHSPSLKTKKHWNSFTTGHFILSEDIIEDVTSTGKPKLLPASLCKELLGKELKCHKCDFKPKNMPQLKEHLVTHLSCK